MLVNAKAVFDYSGGGFLLRTPCNMIFLLNLGDLRDYLKNFAENGYYYDSIEIKTHISSD